MDITYSKRFSRAYRNLPGPIKKEAEKKEKIFRQNPFDHRLKTHKLKGHLIGLWSFSVTYKYRVLFEFRGSERSKVYFFNIGDHDIYQ